MYTNKFLSISSKNCTKRLINICKMLFWIFLMVLDKTCAIEIIKNRNNQNISEIRQITWNFTDENCQLLYNNTNIKDINVVINKDIQKLKKNCNHYISITFNNTFFDNNKLTNNCLDTNTTIFNSLTFSNCNITTMDTETFESSKYPNLINLQIFNNDVIRFKKNMLSNTGLKKLSIVQNTLAQFEIGFLNSSLEVLQIQCGLTIVEFSELFGFEQKFALLIHLDLSYNNINMLVDNAINAISMKSLYLPWNMLGLIHEEAFQQMPNLEFVDLSYNQLLTLPVGVFGDRITGLHITNNPWECKCTMEWLKKFYEKLVCKDPIVKCYNGQTFEETDFCKGIIPTTTPGIKSTTEIITCASADIPINKKSVTLFVRDITSDSVTVTFLEANPYKVFDIVWFDIRQFSKSTQVTRKLSDDYKISNLQPDTSYTICIKSHEDSTVQSPLNCISVTTLEDSDNQTWISNKNKTLFIGLVHLYFVILILATGLIVYLYVLFHPELLGRNKRVIVVKQSPTKCIFSQMNAAQVDQKLLYDYVTYYKRPEMSNIIRNLSDLSRKTEMSTISRNDDNKSEAIYESIDDLYSEVIYEDTPGLPKLPRRNNSVDLDLSGESLDE